MQDTSHSASEHSAAQYYLDQLSWVKIPPHLVYSQILSAKVRALRIKLECFATMISKGSEFAPLLSPQFLSKVFGFGEKAARSQLKKLRENGLLKGETPVWPRLPGLRALKPLHKYLPPKVKTNWFHRAPRLLVGHLGTAALLIYFHLKHKELNYWVEVRKERKSSWSELSTDLRLSKRDVGVGLEELRRLCVVDWTKGNFKLLGLHAENVNLFRSHFFVTDADVCWLRHLGYRWHSMDVAAQEWCQEFAPNDEIAWASDSVGTSFWYRSAMGRVPDLVPPSPPPWDAIGVHPVWGYGPSGLHPSGGNEEKKTKMSPPAIFDGRQVALETLEFNKIWIELVPPFMSVPFLEHALESLDAARWIALWFDGLNAVGNLDSEVLDSAEIRPRIVTEWISGTALAQLLLQITNEISLSDAADVKTAVAAVAHIMSRKPDEYVAPMTVAYEAAKDGLPLFKYFVAAARGATGRFKEGTGHLEEAIAEVYSGDSSCLRDWRFSVADVIGPAMSAFPLNILQGAAIEKSLEILSHDFHPVTFLWERLRRVRRKRSLKDHAAYVDEIWEDRATRVPQDVARYCKKWCQDLADWRGDTAMMIIPLFIYPHLETLRQWAKTAL